MKTMSRETFKSASFLRPSPVESYHDPPDPHRASMDRLTCSYSEWSDIYPPHRPDGYTPQRPDGYTPQRPDGYTPQRPDTYPPPQRPSSATETPENPPPTAPRPTCAWDTIHDEINNIDDCSAMFRDSQPIPLKARSSDAFARVMGDMKSRLAEQKARAAMQRAAVEAMKRARLAAQLQQHQQQQQQQQDDSAMEVIDAYASESEEDDDEVNGPGAHEATILDPRRQAAIRAWRLIRSNLQEVICERRKKHTTINWTFLRQHIEQDHERARQELYEKYIFKPNSWAEGLVRIPENIFEEQKPPVLRTRSAGGGHKARSAKATTKQSLRAASMSAFK